MTRPRPVIRWLSPNWSASGNYRAYLPAHTLHRHPYNMDAYASTTLLAADVADSDVIVATPEHPDRAAHWQRLTRPGQVRVVDLDDDPWVMDETNPAYHEWRAGGRSAALEAAVRHAHVVTCASPRIARNVEARFPDLAAATVVIGNFIPADLAGLAREYAGVGEEGMRPPGPAWPPTVAPPGVPPSVRSLETWTRRARSQPPVTLRGAERNGALVIGWAGSDSTLPDLQAHAPAVRAILKANPAATLRTVGAPRWAVEAAGIPADRIHCIGWQPTLLAYLSWCATFDVWISPYRNTDFNAAKYPTKRLEAAALGIPLVTNLHPDDYGWAHTGGHPGSLVGHCTGSPSERSASRTDPDEWVAAVADQVDRPRPPTAVPTTRRVIDAWSHLARSTPATYGFTAGGDTP